jgi:hypothetical protein
MLCESLAAYMMTFYAIETSSRCCYRPKSAFVSLFMILQVTNKDVSFPWVLHWLTTQGRRSQHLSVNTAIFKDANGAATYVTLRILLLIQFPYDNTLKFCILRLIVRHVLPA